MKPIIHETLVERRQLSLRWSAIIGGAVLGIGVWIFLQMLGMGLGLVSVEVDAFGAPRGASWLGAWSMIAPLLAMFVGGGLAAYYASTYDRRSCITHAVMAWALAAVVGTFVRVWMITAVVTAATRADITGVDELTRVDTTNLVGRVLLTGSIALLLGLIGSVIGGIVLGMRRELAPRRHDTIETPAVPAP
jgi:MFS family permease